MDPCSYGHGPGYDVHQPYYKTYHGYNGYSHPHYGHYGHGHHYEYKHGYHHGNWPENVICAMNGPMDLLRQRH